MCWEIELKASYPYPTVALNVRYTHVDKATITLSVIQMLYQMQMLKQVLLLFIIRNPWTKTRVACCITKNLSVFLPGFQAYKL